MTTQDELSLVQGKPDSAFLIIEEVEAITHNMNILSEVTIVENN